MPKLVGKILHFKLKSKDTFGSDPGCLLCVPKWKEDACIVVHCWIVNFIKSHIYFPVSDAIQYSENYPPFPCLNQIDVEKNMF
jgi:hypothetical protein